MAEILEFRPADSRRDDDDLSASDRGPAEVVVFPGVRYERWEEMTDHEGETSRTAIRRRRDVIELAE